MFGVEDEMQERIDKLSQIKAKLKAWCE